jgi:hypothetical protein
MRIGRRRIGAEFLQWFGLFGAALTWAGQHVAGVYVTLARCGAASGVLAVALHPWEIALMAAALGFVLLSEAAAIRVLLQTRNVDHSASPPAGRRHFFALAAVPGNLLFFVIIILSGVSTLVHHPCQQA